MLLSLIEKYKSLENAKILIAAFNKRSLRKSYRFYDDKINYPWLSRGIRLLFELFSLQLILGKDIYIPGIWLFGIEPNINGTDYLFPDYWERTKEYRTFIQSCISENNKLDYSNFANRLLQVKKSWTEKFTLISNNLSKIEILNKQILNTFWDFKVVLKDKYIWSDSWKEIQDEYKKHSNQNIFNYISQVEMKDILFNPKILEDILCIIWYVENNQKP